MRQAPAEEKARHRPLQGQSLVASCFTSPLWHLVPCPGDSRGLRILSSWHGLCPTGFTLRLTLEEGPWGWGCNGAIPGTAPMQPYGGRHAPGAEATGDHRGTPGDSRGPGSVDSEGESCVRSSQQWPATLMPPLGPSSRRRLQAQRQSSQGWHPRAECPRNIAEVQA